MKLSNRLSTVPASPIRKLVPYALDAKKQGVGVYHLNIGDPDIKTPEVMLDVVRNWKTNPVGYENSQGNAGLISALVSYYGKLGYSFVKSQDIQITTGGSEAILFAMLAAADPGDEIIVFEPFYANYNSYAAVAGVRLVPVTTSIANGFHLPDRAAIEAVITPKTKAILICTPNNPTGTVYTKAEMDMLVSIVSSHGLFLLSDEVYREFAYDGISQVSVLSYMEAYPDLMVVLDSLSKRYSLCGARLGCLVSGNSELMSGVLRLAQGRLASGLIDQTMAAKLTEVPPSYTEDVRKEYGTRRDTVVAGLSSIPGVTIMKPEGAFYIIAKLPVSDAEDFCKYLLTDFRLDGETVMLAPASGFYATPGLGHDEVRLAYVLNVESLVRSVEIIRQALEQY